MFSKNFTEKLTKPLKTYESNKSYLLVDRKLNRNYAFNMQIMIYHGLTYAKSFKMIQCIQS